ncbi:MAG: NAD(P)/FAD-dependent oxidoreductase [Gammaproteobacteria bacterium]|nr:MAG: NAD(P)/FAD-dependent oxidoreductase [Gammaproteobacteria bacterium]
MRHLIIGAGPAGVIAAETLRKIEPEASITLIGDEPEPPYSRMAIPYLLNGQIDEAGTYLRKTEGHYETLGIELRQGRVTTVDPAAHTATLESGDTLNYDRLLVATGSRPVAPPIDGMDLPGVHPCWTMAHAREISTRAQPGSRVVLMGAGFIGSIILESLVRQGAELTVVEMEDRMVPRMMNSTAGGMLKSWCQDKGVVVLTSTRVKAVTEAGKELEVQLESGEVIKADLGITATGVRANCEFLQDSGIELDGGVRVNTRMQSSDTHVFAAGDVAVSPDLSTGEYSAHAIQPAAADHGRVAAINMSGRVTCQRGTLHMNVLDTMGLISSSFGQWMGVDGGQSAELCDDAKYRYLNLQFQDDQLVGASSVGITENIGVLRGLIQSRVRLGKQVNQLLDDPTRFMQVYIGSTQTIDAAARLSL